MKWKDITGVILAAGRGNRIYPFNESLPKPLLPICAKPLICYQLEIMQRLGIKKVFIVIGRLGFEIVRNIGDGSNYGMSIAFVEQNEALGIAHAVGQLESMISAPFLLFLGDIFFVSEQFHEMLADLKDKGVNAVLAAKYESKKELIKRNFSIVLDKDGQTVRRVIEKPRYIQNNLKGCGLYLFDQHIFDAIRRTPRTAMRDEYEITESIQILIDDGFKVQMMAVIEEDLNLTYAHDLHFINLYELKRRGIPQFIGKNCQIKNKEMIVNSVVGDNVRIDLDIEIVNSVVFSNVHIEKTFDKADRLENVILANSDLIPVPVKD